METELKSLAAKKSSLKVLVNPEAIANRVAAIKSQIETNPEFDRENYKNVWQIRLLAVLLTLPEKGNRNRNWKEMKPVSKMPSMRLARRRVEVVQSVNALAVAPWSWKGYDRTQDKPCFGRASSAKLLTMLVTAIHRD